MSPLKHKERRHDGHEKADLHEETTLSGVVSAYNFSPKGGVEGMFLRDGEQSIQVNFPPEIGIAIALMNPAGQSVEVTVRPEHEPKPKKLPEGGTAAYRLVSLRASDGRVFGEAGPDRGEAATVEGVVARLNYTRHGDANGVILETGEFIHLKPDGMKQTGLEVGQRVTAEGRACPTPLGSRVIEAALVNGISIGPRKPHH